MKNKLIFSENRIKKKQLCMRAHMHIQSFQVMNFVSYEESLMAVPKQKEAIYCAKIVFPLYLE